MNRNRLKIGIMTLLSVVFFSCEKSDLSFPDSATMNPNAIRFQADVGIDFTTRSAGYNGNAPRAIKSMGIFAAYTDDRWVDSDPNNNFMSDLKVERESVEEPWLYQPEHLWPGNGYVAFFGYAPHRDHPIYAGNKPVISQTSGVPKLSYTIADTHDQQVDLLIATPLKDQKKHDYVTMPLRHALTKIAFSARLVNAPVAGTTYKVTKVVFSNILNSGTIEMDGSNRVWTPGVSTATYMQDITNGGLSDLSLTSTYQSLTPVEGHLFLLPQQLTDEATVTVTYEVTSTGAPTPVETSKTMQLNLAITRWNPGDAYNLMFSIDDDSEPSFIVVPAKWDDTEIQVDVKNRILNVSRIEANVYPGVATRIYFWSNQPKDSVYVRSLGNMDASKYPTGASYVVNDVFQELSGIHTTTPTYAPRIVYGGFNGKATDTGEGYIDVLIKDNDTNPFLPKVTDGDQRHIWLNASGLARSVKLNAIVRSNLTTTPYVGTFHRWNETGERIITWSFNGVWTAEIDDQGGEYKEVLIDNIPSPYMSTGQLYGAPAKEVGDPEAAKLNPASNRQINGKGRIYFRVGWKTRLSDRATSRYARIKVSGTNIGGLNKNQVYLYLRQGESDDYMMVDYGDRPAAVKWSPFNLTVAGLTKGGGVQVLPNRANARFVQYPTQAGGIYKWVSPVQSVLPTAYAPVGTISFEQVTYKSFWFSVMSVQESCPPGYRRPNRGSISASVSSGTTVESEELLHSLFEKINNSANVNEPSNSLWGYYADGFFDRRRVENAEGDLFDAGKACAVEPLSEKVGYIGRLFYNPEGMVARGGVSIPYNSLFFPAAGYRSDEKQLKDGTEGHYWTSSGETRGNTLGWQLVVGSGATAYTTTSDLYGMSVRCVRDIGFSTDLIPDKEVVVPTSLTYNANSSSIDALYITKWINLVAQGISTLPQGSNLRAKITFTGTVTSGTDVANSLDLLSSDRIASGSTVVFDFTRATMLPATKVQISVENTEWEYNVFNGTSFVQGGSGRTVSFPSSTAASNRGIILRKR